MKRILFLMMTIIISSCAMNRVQVYEMQGENEFENEHIKVSHKFWDAGGNSGFWIYNKTDKPIYIDLSRTHSIINSEAITFYQQRSITSNTYTKTTKTSVGTETKVTNVSFEETIVQQRINEIPANSYKKFSGYPIYNAPYRKDGFDTKKQGNIKFSEENTPIKIKNIISYFFDGENELSFETSTWVRSIEIDRYPNWKKHGFYVIYTPATAQVEKRGIFDKKK